jgi:hypothetical protein
MHKKDKKILQKKDNKIQEQTHQNRVILENISG